MCLITDQKEPIILEEDIIVYKLLTDDMRSITYDKEWEYDKLEVSDIKESEAERLLFNDNKDMLDSGFSNLYQGSIREFAKDNNLIAFEGGLHFARTYKRAEIASYRWNKIVKCLIPKGSKVYYNKSGLGVTNQLMIIK